MSLYGKLGAMAISAVIVGGSALYVAELGNNVMAQASSLSEALACYVICEHQGSIALFEEGEDQPLAVYSFPTECISAADAALLKEGIRVRGLDEVLRLLEDLDIEN